MAAIGWRLLRSVDRRLLVTLGWQLGVRGIAAIERFKKRLRNGDCFPAFFIISLTDACNLRCQGCWVSHQGGPRRIEPEVLDRVIGAARKRGCGFFGILGGEPLLYPGLNDLFARHRDCYFQVFTNGTLITDAVAAEWRRLGNVTPLVSIEGLEAVSDLRRGGRDVFRRSMAGLEACVRHRLFTGVATSVCQSNIDDLASDRFLGELVKRGVHYAWYYIYRPVGPEPRPDLALTAPQIRDLRRFVVTARTRHPIIVVDAYWDEMGRALCPAAVGISYHIGPGGDIEPCPPMQFARDGIGNGTDLRRTVGRSRFLADFRTMARATTRGCVLLDDPAGLAAFMRRTGARDTSGRGVGLVELEAMRPQASHHQPGDEIPERSRAYRFAKRHWFFGFGAYG